MKELESRLADLEREVVDCRRKARRDRTIAGGLALIVAAFLIGGTGRPQDVADELNTKKLTVVDDAGKARVTLSADTNDATLEMRDENGNPRVILTTDKEEARLWLLDAKVEPRVSLTTDKAGPRLWLLDEKGQTRARLDAGKEGPSLMLADEKGNGRAMLGTNTTKSPVGVVVTYPESTLLLFGPDEKILWQAPSR